jgi:hypothetical protein
VLALVTALGPASAVPAEAQEEGRPTVDAPSRKVMRTKRLRVPADLFERDAVSFKRARVEVSGTIRADGHNLDLYGMEPVPRNRICAAEGARWGRAASARSLPRGGCWKDNPSAATSSRPRARRKPCAGSATPT